MDIDAYPKTWCRMWNDDPQLAHTLVTDDFSMWFGLTQTGDDVHGPAALADFVAGFRRDRGSVFTPRVLVSDDEGRFAYTWDARLRDGSVVSGIDVNLMEQGLVRQNWSIAGQRPCGQDDALPSDGKLDRAGIAGICEAWSPLWNGDVGLAKEIVTPGFRIWFGAAVSAADEVEGPDGLAGYVSRFRAGHEDLRFGKHREPVIDVERQRAAFTWSATSYQGGEPRTVGGIDAFQLEGGRLARAWSVTGARPFAF